MSGLKDHPRSAGLATLERLAAELRQLELEIVEREYARRADGLAGIRDAVRRLGEVGSPAGILDRAASELGGASLFERLLISEVADGRLTVRAVWARNGSGEDVLERLRAAQPIRLEYPLIEHEVVRARRAELVSVSAAGPRSPAGFREALEWSWYAVAPIVVDNVTVGLLHADVPAERRAPDAVDLELAVIAAEGLGEMFDRAVLRDTLQRHRAELQSAVKWLGSRVAGEPSTPGPAAAVVAGSGDHEVVDALTARELEVLALMARGQTNAAIANALVVREGTVKYHVKNVLRKLNARSRADAVARYARATGPGSGDPR